MLIKKEFIHKIQQISSQRSQSLFVVLPHDICTYLKLSKGMKMKIDVKKGRIIISKIEGEK